MARQGIAALRVVCVAVAVVACGPAPDKVGAMTLAAMRQKFSSDPQFSQFGIEVLRVQVVKEGDNRFQGIATVRHEGDLHEVPVQITAEGENVIWKTDAGAFAFVAQKAFQKAMKAQ